VQAWQALGCESLPYVSPIILCQMHRLNITDKILELVPKSEQTIWISSPPRVDRLIAISYNQETR